jgi:hypothetical protein
MTGATEKKSGHGLSGMMDDLKEKFHHTKIHEELHDAKVSLIHKKLVSQRASSAGVWLT